MTKPKPERKPSSFLVYYRYQLPLFVITVLFAPELFKIIEAFLQSSVDLTTFLKLFFGISIIIGITEAFRRRIERYMQLGEHLHEREANYGQTKTKKKRLNFLIYYAYQFSFTIVTMGVTSKVLEKLQYDMTFSTMFIITCTLAILSYLEVIRGLVRYYIQHGKW